MPVFSGQGIVLIGPRTVAGNPGPMRWVGEIDPKGVSVDFKVDIFPVKESSSGQRMTMEQLVQAKEGSVKFGFQEYNVDNLALQVMGAKLTVAAGTVTGEVLPTVVAGEQIGLRYPKVSSVVITDSAGTPVTLDADNYEVTSANFGRLTFKDVTGLTQPFLAAYSYAGNIEIPILNAGIYTCAMRFELINTANANTGTLVELYRCQIPAAKTLELIQEKGIAMPQIEAALLIDPSKPFDNALGQFGRIAML